MVQCCNVAFLYNIIMKNILLILLFCNCAFSQNQVSNTSKTTGAQRTLHSQTCADVPSFAKRDISDNKISIFIQSGIAAVIYKTDPTFEKMYSLKYNDLGCIGNECAEAYNQTIFDYLSVTYGKKWIKSIRKDVLGLKKWQKSKT